MEEIKKHYRQKELDTVGEPHIPRWFSGPKYPKPRIWVSKDTLKKKKKMQKIIIVIVSLLFTSCGMLCPLTDKEKELDYKLDILYLDYQYKRDSIIYYHYKLP